MKHILFLLAGIIVTMAIVKQIDPIPLHDKDDMRTILIHGKQVDTLLDHNAIIIRVYQDPTDMLAADYLMRRYKYDMKVEEWQHYTQDDVKTYAKMLLFMDTTHMGLDKYPKDVELIMNKLGMGLHRVEKK